MALKRQQVPSRIQERLASVAAEIRAMLYGEEGCPEWGTPFVDLEADGMAIGLELARLTVEQSVSTQAEHMPAEAFDVEDEVQKAGTRRRTLKTEAGEVAWDEPRAYMKQGRRAFFPSGESIAGERRQRTVSYPGTQGDSSGDPSSVVPGGSGESGGNA